MAKGDIAAKIKDTFLGHKGDVIGGYIAAIAALIYLPFLFGWLPDSLPFGIGHLDLVLGILFTVVGGRIIFTKIRTKFFKK